MSPKEAKVFLVEDVRTFREAAKRHIEKSSHTVVMEATTLRKALASIEEAKRCGVNVAVVDGNLTEDDISNYDGNRIAQELRREIPEIKIVSFSSVRQTYGDVHVKKMDYPTLGRVITRL